MAENTDITDITAPQPQAVIAQIREVESRGWHIVPIALAAGIGFLAATASSIGRLAVYNAGLACIVTGICSSMFLVLLYFIRMLFTQMAANKADYGERFDRLADMESQTLSGIGGMLGVAENELGQRRGRG